MEGYIIPIIIVFVVIYRVLKKVLESMAQQGRSPQRGEDEYEASAQEVQRFLQGLRVPPQQATGADRGVPARLVPEEGPRPEARLVPESSPLGPGVAVLPSTLARPQQGADSAPPQPLPSAGKPRKRRAAPRKREARRRLAAVAPSEPRKAPPKAASSLRDVRLKHAVIWSEILGPPLIMRPRRAGQLPKDR